ncbi:MAG: hypothetical protein AMJ64_05345 [Betaproteobacteria bacterium SG8_39]|nr:MAG: hypothetical protein AMJ64_05345 [Betaproteobacteria bacterium SG8_39]
MTLLEWILSSLGLYVTTVGALLLFLYMYRSPQVAEYWASPEGKTEYGRHRRRMVIGTGLLAAWLVLENAASLFLN